MDKSELALQSTTGQRMNLIGSNPVLNLENSQLDMKATTGRGIYLQGATPQVFMENSQLLMTDTGASQGMILQGTDALLSLSNKSELSIIGAGTGTAENIQIGKNNARPELLVAGESKVSVTTTSGTEAATDTANNAIHLRGADPKATFNNAELYIEILSGARRGLVMNGGGGKIDIVSDSNFEVNTNDAYSLALFDDSNKIFIDGKATKVNLLSKFTAGGNTDSTLYTGANSLVNTEFIVDNGAELNVFANNSIAILLQGQGTNFTIQGNSSVVAKNNQTSELMATVRFMHAGNANFIIDNASINIEKEGGAAPGLRLLGSDNHVQVRNGGTFFLNNKGSGNPSDGNVNSNGNQGVQLTEGNETSFSVTDPGSQAIIIAGSGPAIDLSGTGKVRNSNGGYFEAVGRTATASGGIFRAGVLDVEFDNPLFMDFTNRRPGGGNIFSVANGSNLKATNSDLAVWKNGSNLDGDPDLNFPTLDFSFSGTNFNTLGVTNQPDVLNTGNFGTTGLTAYSRLSSNNARWAIADELRVPTNADKKIYGHVSIPVGLKEKRSAWEGEAAVTIEVERVDGRKIDYTAKTVGHSNEKPGISIYGEEPRTGLFEVNLEERLQKGDKVKIKEVRLTSGELTQGYENIILTDTIEVFPIIPPPPATFSSSIIAQDSTTIQGMTDNLDAEVTATHNGEPLNTESVTIDADGRFTIDLSEVSLEMDDKIQVFIRDAEGSALEAGVINPPETNNTRGNINPSTELTFHDVTFKSATTLIVGELGPVLPVDPLDPEVEVNPENKPLLPEDQGQLSIDFVSSFNFGSQAISVYDQTYYAQPQRLLNEDGTVNVTEERPNYVQISDRRPENERNGWELAVTQNNQFTDRQGNQLKGARLLLNNQQFASVQESGEPILRNQDGAVLIPEQKMPLVTAHDGQEAGTWIYRLGDGESAGESVALEVPPTADPRATTYQTTLIWELSAVPDN
ncbi:MAG TPA: hypothetical protein DIT57_13300 [Enterococcus sp.]|nr:hypothetical protein [Enterococcus sp.]